MAAIGAVATVFGGCSATEYHYEGPGLEDDPASSSVPTGMIGVCKRRFTEKPPIVSKELWEHAKWCTASTPPAFVRLGFGHERGDVVTARKRVQDMMDAISKGEAERNNAVITKMMGDARDAGKTDPWLAERISKQSARTSICDYQYMFEQMQPQAKMLRNGDEAERRCAARAYDQKERREVCLFDTTVQQAVWLTSGWACMTRTGETGNTESCHQLCQFDDYCVQQVSCATSDIDLALCALGVCLPSGASVVY